MIVQGVQKLATPSCPNAYIYLLHIYCTSTRRSNGTIVHTSIRMSFYNATVMGPTKALPSVQSKFTDKVPPALTENVLQVTSK